MFTLKKSLVFFLSFSLATVFIEANHSRYPNFDDHPYLSKKTKETIEPFLLPKGHSLKKRLDSIFLSPGITRDEASFAKKGFKTLSVRHTSFIRIAKHPLFPNHLFKLFLDSEKRKKEDISGWKWLARRCEGARNIKELIKKKKLRHFVVPEKWLYPLPPPSEKHVKIKHHQPVILIVENMKLASWSENVDAWRNKITKEHLRELYCILSHGYSSCYVRQNIPYTRNGKFACIDTEHPKRNLKPQYAHVKTYLSNEMKQYWELLIRTGGRG